jgi:hypothetical protein
MGTLSKVDKSTKDLRKSNKGSLTAIKKDQKTCLKCNGIKEPRNKEKKKKEKSFSRIKNIRFM